jgi:hypothetical protein
MRRTIRTSIQQATELGIHFLRAIDSYFSPLISLLLFLTHHTFPPSLIRLLGGGDLDPSVLIQPTQLLTLLTAPAANLLTPE